MVILLPNLQTGMMKRTKIKTTLAKIVDDPGATSFHHVLTDLVEEVEEVGVVTVETDLVGHAARFYQEDVLLLVSAYYPPAQTLQR